jgi:GxGYxYP putative glycoside hydrolase C-terminal domain/GxGYxY sequence motif in domain of unknown function N-terminal
LEAVSIHHRRTSPLARWRRPSSNGLPSGGFTSIIALAALATAIGASTGVASAGTLAWPLGQALPTFATARHLDIADVEPLAGDEQLLFNTLEGIVNRVEPRIYLLWGADEGKRTWLDTLRGEYGVATTDVPSAWSLLTAYRPSIAGMIVYDPKVPDSINVATTLAALHGAVVASPTLAVTLAAAPYDIPVLEDLRGRFCGRLDAYNWAYENLWLSGLVTHRMLVGLPPLRSGAVHLADLGGVNIPLEPLYDTGLFGGDPFPSLRDYAVAVGSMVVWLDPNEPAERLLLERMLRDMPADSPYLGSHPGDVVGEITIVAVLSAHSVYEVAADFFNNGSVFGGVRPTLATPSPAPPAPPLENKIYVTFTMSDGDNVQYDQRRLRSLWDNPARGSVPINWTISPLLLDAAPAMLDHYRRTATANDLLMAGPSGAGYAYPSSWPGETFRTFTARTGDYMRRAGIDTLDVLNAPYGLRLPLSETKAQGYIADVAPKGILLNYNFFPECRTDNVIVDGTTPVTTGCVVSSASTAQGEAEFDILQQSLRWDGTAPFFISIEFIAWNVTPADVAAVASTLDPSRYAVVRADQYFDLLREAHDMEPAPVRLDS